jgi:hypothetical protein
MVSVAMKRNLPVFLALAAAGLVSGCGSPQINRIDKYREIYEQWPIEVKQAVLDGHVQAGMTQDMVIVAWGQPTEKINRSNATNDEEIWIYRKGGDDGTMMVPMGGPSYPGGGYPGGVYPGGGYPGAGYPGGVYGGGGPGIGISTGRGGTGITTGVGTGIGMGGMGGMGTTPVIMTRPTPGEEREVVFRNGVVYRADSP